MKTFNLPLSIRIHLATRAVEKARKAYAYAGAYLRCHYDNNGECFDGMGLSALRAIVAEANARRAMWDAEDNLFRLNPPARAIYYPLVNGAI